ncbi:generic methyltransferase [Methanospirillum hungatei JF-1]|uniref:Generic methyltransferase n=1 Tax=Methanospirillum hungatei JF-1 (strain ATCC 27890 / DSM 864 / NBRC 100397 / JF-1) TaxID=323259 RepID=Q2FNG4_METHJ|nr:class I SAM-dependent methyltransferase [Methanospirillum hungatei]ABD42793.1 generic methyltransferase [Methanospirillum hungatei JF-1]
MIQCPECKSLFKTGKPPLCCPSCNYQIEERDGVFCLPVSGSDEYFFPTEGFSLLYKHEAKHFWFRSRNEIIGAFLKRYLPGNADHTGDGVSEVDFLPQVCEVGCGTGLVSQYLTRMGYRMTCADMFLEGLSFARKRNSGEKFFRCNLYDLPFYDEFDAVIACDVLEHLDDDELALHRLYQAIKPGGICLITVPAGESLWSAIDQYAGHKRRYHAKGLMKKVSLAGFTPIRLSYFMTIPYPILLIKRMLLDIFLLHSNREGEEDYGVDELMIPGVLNELLYHALWLERKLIHFFDLPVGSSLICIAQKPVMK